MTFETFTFAWDALYFLLAAFTVVSLTHWPLTLTTGRVNLLLHYPVIFYLNRYRFDFWSECWFVPYLDDGSGRTNVFLSLLRVKAIAACASFVAVVASDEAQAIQLEAPYMSTSANNGASWLFLSEGKFNHFILNLVFISKIFLATASYILGLWWTHFENLFQVWMPLRVNISS